MLTKSKAAFLLSVEKLFGLKRRVYMWTFTFPVVRSDEESFACWNHLAVLLKREWANSGGVPGIRVVEVHPGGHGLHFHVLIARRLPVEVVRRLAIRAGFGRIHVVKAKRGAAEYLAKYLGKQSDGLRKGCRRWGFFGSFQGTRIKDIVVESILADNCRRVRAVVKTWGRDLFIAVNQLTAKFGSVAEWPIFDELKVLPAGSASDNDWRLPDGCNKDGVKARFTTIKLYNRELDCYVTHLLPAIDRNPF